MKTRNQGSHVDSLLFAAAVMISVSCVMLVGCAAPQPANAISVPLTAESSDQDTQTPQTLSLSGAFDSAPGTRAPAPAGSTPLGAAPPSSGSAPDPIVSAPARPLERVRVDAMVGQINGRPLFASEFFSTMDARLRAEAQRRTPEDWLRFARQEIRQALRDRVRDELLLSEVETSLSPEQRAGLVAFVRSLRDNLISENRGSEELADRRLIEAQGITLEEAVEARKNEELIRTWLRRILQNKVHVPWRDVKLRYERDRDVYNPPSSAKFRMIRLPRSETDEVDVVREAVAAGAEFSELASKHSRYNAEEGGQYEAIVAGDSYQESQLIGLPELNTAAQGLVPGEIAGPIQVGANVYWVKLESIDRVNESLYSVQVRIQEQLFSERVRIAEESYFQELLDHSGLSTSREIDRIETRLFEIAAERYLFISQR